MQLPNSFFNTRYPILCMPMNQVSDLNLAVAVSKAGALPSLVLLNYFENGNLNYEKYINDLSQFKELTGSHELMLSLGFRPILYEKIVEPFFSLGFKHIELYHVYSNEDDWNKVLEKSEELVNKYNAKILFKLSTTELNGNENYSYISVKGTDGAGRVTSENVSTLDKFREYKTKFPNLGILPSGGIYSSSQIQTYLQEGAIGVGIGSLFAASHESSISVEVKNKIINSTSNQLSIYGPFRSKGLFAGTVENDDTNLTKTLRTGITDPTKGCVFMGNAIDYITEIKTVNEIVKSLMDLNENI